jgi:uncharacterized tellurite resistance protein B-like protein
MPVKSIRAWLGLDRPETPEPVPLRDVLAALDHLEPARARYLAAFAYLLGRVAHADQHVSPEETRAIETALMQHGELTEEQAMLVTQLAKKLALLRCIFAVSASDDAISLSEESELHRLARELRIDPPDLLALRMEHQRHLPGRNR